MNNLNIIKNNNKDQDSTDTNNKILKAHYLLKQPNIYILLRWPAFRPGLQFGIIKKDFNIIEFVLEGKSTYIVFEIIKNSKQYFIKCQLKKIGPFNKCLERFNEVINEERIITEKNRTFTNNYTEVSYYQPKPASLVYCIQNKQPFDLYSPHIIIDCDCLKCRLQHQQQKLQQQQKLEKYKKINMNNCCCKHSTHQ
jgi:hypothetical protein